MSKSYWLTTEEMLKKKKRKKNLTYSFGTVLVTAFVTILANSI